MSSARPLTSDDASKILLGFHWKPCESKSLQDFCRMRWGVPLGEPEVLDPWPGWQTALTSEAASPEIIDAALELKIIPDRNHMTLPHTKFYAMGDTRTFSALNATNNRIALREEYDRLYLDIEYSGRSAVITGQPGSGKTYFLYYCLLVRLSLSMPVLLSPGSKEWFLFTEWGAWHTTKFTATLNDDSKHEYLRVITPGTWALIEGDTRPKKKDIDHQLWIDYLDVTTVLTSAPHAGRYDNWLRSSRSPLLRIIKPASFLQVVQGCRLLHGEQERLRFRMPPNARQAFENLLRFMLIFGAAESSCLRSFLISYADAVSMLRREIGLIQFPDLQKIFASMEDTSQDTPDSVSIEGLYSLESSDGYRLAVNSIAIIKPYISESQEHIENDTICLSVATPWVLNQLLHVFIVKNTKHVREFVDLCTRHSHTMALAGFFFETVIHTVLADARPEWRDRCTLTEFFPCGKPAHVEYNRYPLRRGHIFNRKRTLETYKKHPPDFDPTIYCQPIAKNNPTFDSILYAAESDASRDEIALEYITAEPLPPLSPSSRLMRSSRRNTADETLKKRSLRREPPVSSPKQSNFTMSFSSSFGQGVGMEQTSFPTKNPSQVLKSSVASAPGPSSSGFRAGSPQSVSELSGAISASGHSSPPMSMTGSDAMTARGYSPIATQSMRERPRPPTSILGRKRQAASIAESRPAKVARVEVPDAQKHCVAMQMTVGKSHSWNEKGVKLLRQCFEETGNWHFVVVTHKRSQLDLKALGDAIQMDSSTPFFRWYHLTVDFATTVWEDIDFNILNEVAESHDTDTVDDSAQ